MKYIYDHDLHIHSKISACSNDPEQTCERILQYAKENNLPIYVFNMDVYGNLKKVLMGEQIGTLVTR